MGVATARGGAEPPNYAQGVPRPESAGEPGREGLPGRQWELEAKRTGFTQGWSGRWRLPSREATRGEVPSSLAAGRALWLLLALSHRTTAPSFTFSGTPPQSRDAGMQDVTLRESVLNDERVYVSRPPTARDRHWQALRLQLCRDSCDGSLGLGHGTPGAWHVHLPGADVLCQGRARLRHHRTPARTPDGWQGLNATACLLCPPHDAQCRREHVCLPCVHT